MDPKQLDTLKKSRLFKNFTSEMLYQIIPKLNVRLEHYGKYEIIFQIKHKVKSIGVVISGELCASIIDYNGQEHLVQKLNPSYTIGAEIAYTESQISPYVLYCFKEAEVFLFPYNLIYEHGHIPEHERILLLQNLLEFMAYINQKRFLKSYILSSKSAKERIMRYLTDQARMYESNSFTISYDREQLANYLCLNRSVLSHELSGLKKEGMIDFHKNKFWLKK